MQQTTNYVLTTWYLWSLCHKISHFLRPSPGAWRRPTLS